MLVEVSYYIDISTKKSFLCDWSHIDQSLSTYSKLWGRVHLTIVCCPHGSEQGSIFCCRMPARDQAHRGSALADISPVTPYSLAQTEAEQTAPLQLPPCRNLPP